MGITITILARSVRRGNWRVGQFVFVLAILSLPRPIFGANDPFTIVALPDTQVYSESNPATFFEDQTNWIKDNVEGNLTNLGSQLRVDNIGFVTHLGDITNNAGSFQFSNSIAAMDILDGPGPDGLVPHGVVRGNHDIENSGIFLDNFGPNSSRFQGKSWYGGAAPSGFSNYQKINAGGRVFIMLGMDIAATTAEVSWAQSVIDANPGIPTMLSLHNYLAEDNGCGVFGSCGNGRGRILSTQYGSDLSPDQVFDELVYPNDEIFMVIAGHSFAQYNIVETNEAGNDVHEILVDYQTLPNGGNGFLRLMEFDLDNDVIHSTTYSPSLNRMMTAADTAGILLEPLNDEDAHAFDINIDFDARYGVFSFPTADINGDGSIFGNGTGTFENDDVVAFVSLWMQINTPQNPNPADLNLDGIADLLDWAILNEANPSLGALVAAELGGGSNVPEPGTAVLIALMAVPILLRIRYSA